MMRVAIFLGIIIPFTIIGCNNSKLSLKKIVAVSLEKGMGCALDEKGHAACWDAYEKSQVAYVKKSNADLASGKFVSISASDSAFCAISDQGKLDCFVPKDLPNISLNALSSLGQFNKVAVTNRGIFCVIDTASKLSCHKLDVSPGIATAQDYTTALEITDFALGEVSSGNVDLPLSCFITKDKALNCVVFNKMSLSPASAPAKIQASKLVKGTATLVFSLGILSIDEKTITNFTERKQDPRVTVEHLDMSEKYREIVIVIGGLCGILDTSEDLKCQSLKHGQHSGFAEKSNEDLKNETFTSIAAGHDFICALRADKTPFCWHPKDLPRISRDF
jgi:hypothetical protein